MNRKISSAFGLAVLLAMTSNVYAAEPGSDQAAIKIHAVTLSAKLNGEKAILIPSSLLVYRDAVPGVFVLENNEARFRMVLPGKRIGSNIEILSGLFGNEVLLRDKLDELHDGSNVKVIR